MTQLVYTGYRQDQFDDQEFPLYAPGRGKGMAGLSPFDVPEGIDIQVADAGQALFTFRYPDKEPARHEALVWNGVVGISAILGVHSWRVLTLQVSAPEIALAGGPLRLDARMAWAWFKDSSDDIRIGAERNAEVIAKIMAAMPATVRESVVEASRSTRLAANRTISLF